MNPIFKARFKDVGVLSLPALVALGQTGPGLRAAGVPWDLRKTQPYCGYEEYEFDVPVADQSDAFNRTWVRVQECHQSLRIIYQVLDRLDASEGEPVMVADKKIAWPAQMSIGRDGQGTSPEHVREIMTQSMESLIHHFKLVTEGFRVPAGQGATRSSSTPRGHGVVIWFPTAAHAHSEPTSRIQASATCRAFP